MWAQEWDQIMDILIPFPKASLNHDVTQALKYQGYTPERMFRLAEEFFTSIGLEPMTSDFWSRSVIVRPADNRPMECHASAEEFFSQTDFRWGKGRKGFLKNKNSVLSIYFFVHS